MVDIESGGDGFLTTIVWETFIRDERLNNKLVFCFFIEWNVWWVCMWITVQWMERVMEFHSIFGLSDGSHSMVFSQFIGNSHLNMEWNVSGEEVWFFFKIFFFIEPFSNPMCLFRWGTNEFIMMWWVESRSICCRVDFFFFDLFVIELFWKFIHYLNLWHVTVQWWRRMKHRRSSLSGERDIQMSPSHYDRYSWIKIDQIHKIFILKMNQLTH